MRTSPSLEPKHDLILYHDELFEGERKKLPFFIAGSLLFVGGGFWMIMLGHQVIGWAILLFFGVGLLTFLVLLTWGPLLVINEQGIRIRSNPLLSHIAFQWSEIAEITPLLLKGNPYVGFALSLAYLETFLHHQPPFCRIFLARRLNRLHPVVLLRADLLPSSVDMLFASIKEHYPTQIQQYSIQFGDTSVFDESGE